MANLIITVIAIALVAVASLMGAYYGGSAFLNNQSAANASTVLNIGQQVAGAWTAYQADNYNNSPTQWSDLTNNNYLATIPTIPAMAGGIAAMTAPSIFETSDKHWYLWFNVGHNSGANPDPNATACLKIIKTATGTSPTSPPTTTFGPTAFANPALSNGTFGCMTRQFPNEAGSPIAGFGGSNNDDANNDYMAFYRVQ